MDAFTFIAEMTKAIAWPLASLALAALVRKPVSLLLEGIRLKNLKVAGVEAEFSREWAEQAQQVAAELPALPTEPKPPLKSFQAFGGTSNDVSPLTVIVGTWVEIEKRVREAASQDERRIGESSVEFPERRRASGAGDKAPFGRTLDELVRAGRVSPATAEGLRGLQQLRNLAVHAPHDEALAARVPEFRAMSEAMLWSLEHDLKHVPRPPNPGGKP